MEEMLILLHLAGYLYLERILPIHLLLIIFSSKILSVGMYMCVRVCTVFSRSVLIETVHREELEIQPNETS